METSELYPKQVLDFVGYQFDLQCGRVRPTPDRWQTLQEKILVILSRPSPSRPICHKIQQQVTSVCVTSTRLPGLGSGCTRPAMGGFGRLCPPTSSHIGQSVGEAAGLPMQENHSDCSRVAKHALVLGFSVHVEPNPTLPNLLTQPFNQTPHRNLSNLNLYAWVRGIPFWNLSQVLHQLTKAPFEPLKEASLKPLTFKTVFLLSLGSGRCRSEIHAWQNRNIRHQSDW